MMCRNPRSVRNFRKQAEDLEKKKQCNPCTRGTAVYMQMPLFFAVIPSRRGHTRTSDMSPADAMNICCVHPLSTASPRNNVEPAGEKNTRVNLRKERPQHTRFLQRQDQGVVFIDELKTCPESSPWARTGKALL